MQGFQITFITTQERRHGHQLLSEWLITEVRRLGIGGATVTPASEGFGRDGRLHAAHFFELAEQPLAITVVASVADTERLFAYLHEAGVAVFYVKAPIEYGNLGNV